MSQKGEPVRFFVNGFAVRGILRDMVIHFEEGSVPARNVEWVYESIYEARQERALAERAEEEQ